jgi:hypothetical protein
MVVEGDTIALSPGTTTTHVARSLRHREGIHIVTSAVNFGSAESSSIRMASSRRPLGVLRSMEENLKRIPLNWDADALWRGSHCGFVKLGRFPLPILPNRLNVG